MKTEMIKPLKQMDVTVTGQHYYFHITISEHALALAATKPVKMTEAFKKPSE